MSRPTDTTVNGKTVSSTDRAALVLAGKHIAAKPSMRPATALRKAGITSEAKIKRLSLVLRERLVERLDRDSRKSAASSGNRPKKRGKSAGTAAALNGSRGPSEKEFRISSAAMPSNTAARPVNRSAPRNITSGKTDLMDLWAEHHARWWSEVIRWSPFGIMLLVMTKAGKTPATAPSHSN